MITLILEIGGDDLSPVSMELMELARRLKQREAAEILAVVYGKKSEQGARRFARESGVETLGLFWEDGEPSGMEVAAALEGVLKTRGARYLLFPHTPSAMDTAPALAVARGLPVIAGVTEFDGASGTFYRCVGGGRSRLHVQAPHGAVVTLQPGALPAAHGAASSGSVTLGRLACPNGPRHILCASHREQGPSALAGARVVLSVGRGIESEEALPVFHRLVEALPGAARACSRPLVDLGWMPYPCQVGITGATISAELYIALGISGSTQHLAGIPQSTTVVSVNRDPNAAIHAISDLIIEGDLLPFMEATLGLLKKKGHQPLKVGAPVSCEQSI